MQTNKLIHEKSPYLLQHAHNPVNWYPWGEEAIRKAGEEDKPIFLSIGYSTCHWCHVMARESFEDEETARLLNDYYVSVKVDREERPDIDSVYMTVCQAVTGQGGWPLTIIMTPDCKPFFAATYLPPRARYGMSGLDEILRSVIMKWRDDRKGLLLAGDNIQAFLLKQADGREGEQPDRRLVKLAFEQFRQSFDESYGGFGRAPKFPAPHNLIFLMRYAQKENSREAMDMAEETLVHMYRGGIADHIGGGFSRYSTDERWLVPHFEKMLYDNALLAAAYLEAYALTDKEIYKTAAVKTLKYVSDELTDSEGGFYCGQDADSDGVEGKYYVFAPEELKEVLGEADAERFCRWYGIDKGGNFEGKSIPNLLDNPDYASVNKEIERISRSVFRFRSERTRLHRDDKILLSWNGLMIAAYAKAYGVLGDRGYLDAARRAERFILTKLTKEDKLLVRYREGEAAGEGKIDDYAFYIYALLELYGVTYETEYLERAIKYGKSMVEGFFDNRQGGFYIYDKDGEQLIVRSKEIYDGAIPAGNSVAAWVLGRLSRLTGDVTWQELFEKQINYLAGNIGDYPIGHSFVLLTLLNALYPSRELICLEPSGEDLAELRKMTGRDAGLTILVKYKNNAGKLAELAPFTRNYEIPCDGARFYLCSGHQCSAPVSSLMMLNNINFD